MMLSKKNSETLENFSEKLEVEGRSLWQDARRRFMHNRAAGPRICRHYYRFYGYRNHLWFAGDWATVR